MASKRGKVIVTGGAGSLGRYVVDALETDYEITIVDTAPSERYAPHGVVDIRDLERLKMIFAGHDSVIHLAALDSIVDAPPEAFFDVNARGTWTVFEAAVAAGVGTVVHCSSVSVYGLDHTNPDERLAYLPIDEDHPVLPSAPYAFSKRFGEILGASYAKKFGMNVCSVRLSGVIVPEMVEIVTRLLDQAEIDWTDLPHAMPDELVIEASYDLTRYRDYIDARDAGEFFKAAIERPNTGYTIYNCGADDTLIPYATLDFAERVNGGLPPIKDAARFQSDPRASALSSDKARRELNWTPRLTWRDDAPRNRD